MWSICPSCTSTTIPSPGARIAAIREEPLRRLGGKEGPPVPLGRGPVPIIHADEVDRISETHEVRAVTWDPAGRAVLHCSSMRERQPQKYGSTQAYPPTLITQLMLLQA